MITTLIALVLSLLAQVQQPNVPVQLKIQGLELANQILLIAKQEQDATTTQATTTVQTPGVPPAQVDDAGGAGVGDQAAAQASTTAEQGTTTPIVSGVTGPEAPTCTLSAQAVAVPNIGWRVYFTWQYTKGAYATIQSGGQVILYPNKGTTFNTSALDPKPYYYLNGAADDQMDVSLDGLAGSCVASTTIPTSN